MDFVPVVFVDSVILFNWTSGYFHSSHRSVTKFAQLSSIWGERATYLIDERTDVALTLFRKKQRDLFCFESLLQPVDANIVFEQPHQFFISRICLLDRRDRDGRDLSSQDAERIKQLLNNSAVPVDYLNFSSAQDAEIFWEMIDAIPCVRKIDCHLIRSSPLQSRDCTHEFLKLLTGDVEEFSCIWGKPNKLQRFLEAFVVRWLKSESQKNVAITVKSECSYRVVLQVLASKNVGNFEWGLLCQRAYDKPEVYVLQSSGKEKRAFITSVYSSKGPQIEYQVVNDTEKYDRMAAEPADDDSSSEEEEEETDSDMESD